MHPSCQQVKNSSGIPLSPYSRSLASRVFEKCGVFHDFFACFVVISLTFLFGTNKNATLLTCVNTCIYNRDPYLFFRPRMPIYEINRKKSKIYID